MLTIPFFISVISNAIIGTLPLGGPFLGGFLAGIMIGEKNAAMVVGFMGAVIGGIFCRIFLLVGQNRWHPYWLTVFGTHLAAYTQSVISGNIFFFALYFGLLGISGALAGAFVVNKIRKGRNK